jgi:signal transduction histidine kinase
VAFLTLYRGEGLHAVVEDASPRSLLESLVRAAPSSATAVEVGLGSLAQSPPFWFFDPRLVRLALDAALNNACRYARRRVWLDAACIGDALVFSVEDDGPGPSNSEPGQWSTGLGTELCRAVARAHQQGDRTGTVRLFERPGGGARFELELP